MNNIYLILGESGSGKTTIQTLLCKQHDLKAVSSYTTRPPRGEDEIGHIFVTDDEFDKLENIVAYTEYNNNRYCATYEQIEDNDLYVIDIDGIDFFKKVYRGNKDIKIIYILSPIHTRAERMEIRNEKFSKIMERVVNDVIAFKNAKNLADLS